MKRCAPCLFAVLSVAAFAAGHKKIQSPKATELESSLGTPMLRRTTQSEIFPPPLVVFPRRTNFVTRQRLEWNYDPDSFAHVSTFTLYMGTNSGVYNTVLQTGTNLFYEIAITNWNERGMLHWCVVTATDEFFEESDASNEAHFPFFGPTHIRITWTANWPTCTLFWETDANGIRSLGNQLAVLHDTNTFAELIDWTAPSRFYYLDKPDILTITLFNPNP